MIEPVYEPVPPELLGTANADHEWIERQLDRINPDRLEMDNDGDLEDMRKLVLEMRRVVSPPCRLLKVKKLHPDAIIPAYQTAGAACFDLHAIDDGRPHPVDPHAAIYRTGLAFEVPAGWVMEIDSRSGQGFNEAIRLSNCSGQIDSDYRGEVGVSLRYDGDPELRSTKYRKGDRIAQAKLVPAPQFQIAEVSDLTATERGAGGFGSTGK
jgi:dUTP pyrophosphatase